jgi:large subunit ribosomal protein L32
MPNPKRRHSQQRSAKRRTHYKAVSATLTTDSTTGETHVRHRAHVSEVNCIIRVRLWLRRLLQKASKHL